MDGNNLVFYCKDCKQMFYASVNSPDCFDNESAEEIKQYLLEGHLMKTVNTATVRKEFNGCKCNNRNKE